MLNFELHKIHLCMDCLREVVHKPLCPSCDEKITREATEFMGDYSHDYFFGNLKIMDTVEFTEIGLRN
jgi:hypothetical protein